MEYSQIIAYRFYLYSCFLLEYISENTVFYFKLGENIKYEENFKFALDKHVATNNKNIRT